MRTAIILLLAVGAVLGTMESTLGQTPDQMGTSTVTALGRLPLYLVKNRGVYANEVRYYIQGADKTLFFTDQGVTFALKGKDRGWTVKLDFVGANPDARPEGRDQQQAVFSYFTGSEKDWKAGLPTFAKVIYRDLWPGIDLVYNGTVNKLKYEFRVAPGVDPKRIRLRYRGATSVTATDTGALRVATPEGAFEDAPPVAWQEIDGRRVPVKMDYLLGEDGQFGFTVGDYDRTRPLVLDPAILVYCGYIGGSGYDGASAVAVDAAGFAYVAGWTSSDPLSFPVRVGPGLKYGGLSYISGDAFVAKLSPAGSLVYCGYIGGKKDDHALGIAVNGRGEAHVVGFTFSDEQTFPVTVGPDLSYNGNIDGFIARLDSTGKKLLYCGYLGGNGTDHIRAIALDASGSPYVTGWTLSPEKTFPARVGPDLTFNSAYSNDPDAFVAKVNQTGSALDYCGYVGGKWGDRADSIAVDSAGCAYVAGYTNSTERSFPVRVGPDLSYNGNGDAFVAKVGASGSSLVYCGYVGGLSGDYGWAIAVDAGGSAYVGGDTASTEKTFPVKVGPYLTNPPNIRGGFVAKVTSGGKSLAYCGYLGGTAGPDSVLSAVVDRNGTLHVAGSAGSGALPVKFGPDLTWNGGVDAFIAGVDSKGAALTYCGYIGGGGDDLAYGIALSGDRSVYVAGHTGSTEQSFPVIAGPDLTYNGNASHYLIGDAFVAKVAFTRLSGSGAARPGGTITLQLAASNDVARSYQLGTSLGPGPIPVDTRSIGLSPDALLAATVSGSWPTVFVGYRGSIDSRGEAGATINLPGVAGLVGIDLYSAFVTLDAAAPSGIRSVSNTFIFRIGR